MKKLRPYLVTLKSNTGYQRLAGGSGDTVRIKSGCVVLKPGDSVGEHVTEGKEEVIIIIKGSAEIVCGLSRPLHAKRHSIVYIPPGTVHDVKNTGRGLLHYVYVVSKV